VRRREKATAECRIEAHRDTLVLDHASVRNVGFGSRSWATFLRPSASRPGSPAAADPRRRGRRSGRGNRDTPLARMHLDRAAGELAGPYGRVDVLGLVDVPGGEPELPHAASVTTQPTAASATGTAAAWIEYEQGWATSPPRSVRKPALVAKVRRREAGTNGRMPDLARCGSGAGSRARPSAPPVATDPRPR